MNSGWTRTVGSLTDADLYSAATEVKVPAFDLTAHDGFVNISSSSIDFTQP